MRHAVGERLAQLTMRLRAIHAALDEALAESSALADSGGPVVPGSADAAILAMGRVELASLERHARELRAQRAGALQGVAAWIRRLPLSPTAELAEQARGEIASRQAAAEQLGRELAEIESAIADWQGILSAATR